MTPPAIDPISVRRGDIWWVSLDPAQGSEIRKTRPAVVLTANGLNRARRTVVCDQLRAVDKHRLTRNLGRISAADLQVIEESVRRILQL